MANTTTAQSTTADDAVIRRLYARGTWKLKSVAHFGGDETRYRRYVPFEEYGRQTLHSRCIHRRCCTKFPCSAAFALDTIQGGTCN